MALHDLVTDVSENILVKSGLTVGGVSLGVHADSAQTISGAVGSLDFGGASWKRFTVTGNLSGSFSFPPLNVPTILDGQRYTFGIEFRQDATGGRTVNLAQLFQNAQTDGAAVANTAPNGVTLVLLTARRESGVTTYTASFPPAIDGAQITTGVVPVARIQSATTGQPGVVQIGTGSGTAAAGNHVHPHAESKTFKIFKSTFAALDAGDYPLCPDLNFSGSVVRLTKVKLHGGASPTATVTLKIGGSTITGISVAADDTESADSDATANNTFVARQGITLALAGVSGSPVMIEGVLHLTHIGNPVA